MNTQHKLTCSFCIFLSTLLLSSNGTPCGHFQFPTLEDFVLTGKENTIIRLPFNVKQDDRNCFANTRFSLQVTKVVSHSSVQCSLMHSNGKCRETVRMPACSCPDATGVYYLNHTLDRKDSPPVKWLWSTDNGVMWERNITFNVLYPPNVTTLSMTTGRQDQCSLTCLVANQSSAEVVCTWDVGNPPVAAHLLDRHGAILQTDSDIPGEIRYRFAAVGCHDAGFIRCEAPGAGQNQSATLLVKCPPVLLKAWRVIQENKSTLLLVNATIHTAHFHECNFTKMKMPAVTSSEREASSDQAQDTGDIVNCLRSISVRGDLPDVTLKLRLDNSGDIRGHWRLDLSNDAGAANLEFQLEDIGATGRSTSQLHVAQETTATTQTASTELISTPSTLNYIATVTAVVVVIVVVSVSVSITVCCVKRANGNNTRHARMLMQGLAGEAFHWPDAPDTDSQSSAESDKSSNTYEEIPDGPESVSPVGLPKPTRRTIPCQAPRDVPDDYLNPVPPQLTAPKSETSPQPPGNQQPLYQDCSSTPLNKT